MSLIADALARARREAATLENARRGRPGLPVVTPPRRPARRRGAVLLSAVTLAGAGAALAWLAGAGGNQPSSPSAAAPNPSPSPTPAAVATRKPVPAPAESGSAAARPPSESAPHPTTVGDQPAPAPPDGNSAPPGDPTPSPTPTASPAGASARQFATTDSGDAAFLPPAANASASLPGRPPLPTRPVPPTPTAASRPPTATPTVAPTPTPDSRPARSFPIDADLGHTKLHLDYIVFRPSAPFASVNGQRVVVGSTIGQARVVAILESEVHLEDRAGRVILRAH